MCALNLLVSCTVVADQNSVADQDNMSQRAQVIVGVVLLVGIVDTGPDIAILGGDAFKKLLQFLS